MTRRAALFLAMSTIALSVLPTNAEDWPTFLHDSARAGVTNEQLQLPLTKMWAHSAPASLKRAWSGASGRTVEGKDLFDRVKFDDAIQVAVAGNRVYFGSSVDHKVYCIDSSSGNVLWTYFTGAPVRLAPTIHENRVYIGSDDGYGYCLKAQDGSLVWKLRLGPADEWIVARGEMISRWPIRTGILVDEGVAYFGAGIFPHENVYICAVNANDGSIIWKNDSISHDNAGRADLSPQGYLLANPTQVFVPSGRSRPSAVNRKTGRVSGSGASSLKLSSGQVAGTTAIVVDNKLLTYSLGSQIAGNGDATYVTTGSVVAKLNRAVYAKVTKTRTELQTALRAIFGQFRGKKITEEEYERQAAAMREKINQLKDEGLFWSVPCTANSAVIVAGTTVFVGGDKEVRAFDSETGKEMWNATVSAEARGLAAANGVLVVSTTDGQVHCFGTANIQATAKRSAPTNPYPNDQWTDIYAAAADQILKNTDVSNGFCLVAGSETGRLAYELAQRSELKIYGIEPDEKKVAAARTALSKAGLYGHRITIHHADLSDIPYSNYFANLIVSDTLLRTGQRPVNPAELASHLKPCGGIAFVGLPPTTKDISVEQLRSWLGEMQLTDQSELQSDTAWAMLTRGKLPGAGSWSHQYGEPGNTACADDLRIKGGLGVLWYGDPGPGEMVNRHEGAVGPVSVNGRLFVQGTDTIMAYDAYNGMFLWEKENSKAVRTGVFQNHTPSNLVANDDSVFVMMDERCVEYDAGTGSIKATHLLPKAKQSEEHEWGYVAYREGVLFGTATRRKRFDSRQVRRGKATEDATDTIFAIDAETGDHLWNYQGKSISHRTIAVGPNAIFFIDSSITSEQRSAMLREDKTKLKELKGEAAKQAEARMKRADLRLAVSIDSRTGKELWSSPVDVTDCSDIGIGGGKLTLMYKDDVLLLGGANANGHYWKQFIAGEFEQRRLVALSASSGSKLWAKDANYRHRPIVVGELVIAEPWAFDLQTGKQHTRVHPLTGEDTPWSFMRPGHHCGMNTATPNMIFFRSGFTGFYDLESDSGTRHFAGHRLGCWINAIPANGLVMIPEASAGCVCMFSIASTIVLEPREPRRPWTIYSGIGATTPIKQIALNLGAPGDRRDENGKLWLTYPRPKSRKTTSLELDLKLETKFLPGGGFVSVDGDDAVDIESGNSWIHSSGAQGISRCTLPLLGKDDKPAIYTVRLYFADSPESQSNDFDIQIQGKTATKAKASQPTIKNGKETTVHEFTNVSVNNNLVIAMTAKSKPDSSAATPLLSGIEVQHIRDLE